MPTNKPETISACSGTEANILEITSAEGRFATSGLTEASNFCELLKIDPISKIAKLLAPRLMFRAATSIKPGIKWTLSSGFSSDIGLAIPYVAARGPTKPMSSIVFWFVKGKVKTSANPRLAKYCAITRRRFCKDVKDACKGRFGSMEGIDSYPIMRATSSAISDVFIKSARHDGGSITHFFSSTSQPTTRKVLATSSGFTSKPRIFETS